MTREKLDAGSVIFTEGALPDVVAYIVEGEAQILKRLGEGPGDAPRDDTVVIGKAVAGEFVGEMAALEGRVHGATVRAIGPMTIDVFPASEFLSQAVSDAALAHRLLTRMSARLHHLNGIYASAVGLPSPAVEEKEPPRVPEAGGAGTVTLRAGSALLERTMSEVPDPLPLPFSVGRRPGQREGSALEPISLLLDDQRPYRLSRAHFSILREGPEICVRDLHSHLGTEVNGRFIGLQFGRDIATLKPGNNIVIAGGAGSPFVFHLHVAS